MFNYVLAAIDPKVMNWIILGVLGVLIVGLLVPSFLMQKKNRKKQQETMESLKVGDTVITIGGVKGEVVAMDATNDTIVIRTGTAENGSTITFFKGAIQMVNPDMQALMANSRSATKSKDAVAVEDDFSIDNSKYEVDSENEDNGDNK